LRSWAGPTEWRATTVKRSGAATRLLEVGLQRKTGQKGKRDKKKMKRGFIFLKNNQTNEFKHKFELKH
jgi:hypothetical protein